MRWLPRIQARTHIYILINIINYISTPYKLNIHNWNSVWMYLNTPADTVYTYRASNSVFERISTVRRNFILSTHTKWITDCFFLILFGEPRPRGLPTILYLCKMKPPAQSIWCLSGMPWHLVAVKIYTYIADCSIISLQQSTCTLYTLIPADAALRRNDTSAA